MLVDTAYSCKSNMKKRMRYQKYSIRQHGQRKSRYCNMQIISKTWPMRIILHDQYLRLAIGETLLHFPQKVKDSFATIETITFTEMSCGSRFNFSSCCR